MCFPPDAHHWDYKNCSTDENGGNDVKGIHSGLHEE